MMRIALGWREGRAPGRGRTVHAVVEARPLLRDLSQGHFGVRLCLAAPIRQIRQLLPVASNDTDFVRV